MQCCALSERGNGCAQGSTFGIPGVEQHAHFLRDVSNATHIRNHLIANWNKANLPSKAQGLIPRCWLVMVNLNIAVNQFSFPEPARYKTL